MHTILTSHRRLSSARGDILSDKGEYFRAFADPVKRQIGYRINDEQASSDKTGGIHEVLEMANMDGKIDFSEAEDLTRHVIPEILFKDIIKAYQNNGPEKIGIQHAIKEAMFDITAGINQFKGHERWNRVSEAIDFAHGILYDYFNDVLGGVFDAEYDETAAATAQPRQPLKLRQGPAPRPQLRPGSWARIRRWRSRIRMYPSITLSLPSRRCLRIRLSIPQLCTENRHRRNCLPCRRTEKLP